MAEVIRMPKMSDTMTEGVIAAWNKKVGDVVKSGDILAEVETDKATMDMESYYDGTLLYIGVEKGQAVPVDAIIAVIGKAGEDFQSLLNGSPAPSAPVEATPVAQETAPVAAVPAVDTSNIKAKVVTMPLLSDTMTEGVIHAWLKKVGDKVKSGDILAEIETDKATMELEAYEDGTLLYIGVEAGKAAKVNGVIAVIGEEGANYQALLGGAPSAPAPAAQEVKVETPKSTAPAPSTPSAAPVHASNSNGRILASPLAKKLAEEKGIKLAEVSGSGEGGRIVKSDVDNFTPKAQESAKTASSTPAPVAAGIESYEEISLTQMRKAIARSLAESQSSAVDFQLTMEICMDKAIQAREVMNQASPVKISFNDMVLKACGVALKKHPNINSSWRDDHIRRNQHVHIGMAVAIAEGLVVPVIRFADTLSLSTLAATTKDLGGKAKNGKLQPKDWEGNTFTVSNLGMFGIEQFTSIINNPKNESCILSVGGIKETVAVKNGQFYATNIMKVTLTCDHRVVDGATGAAFLVTLKELLEEPYKLLV
ncbi:pyruvate dehydrogenase complex dihydrolipoamide acetyltransferase [Emticicia oligotrophica DSM 17448]|uniref:Dihydrolipoamide acetyltransferase component of pyruvate dehydrogenase complex n=1 Tax=Emticicia oligotrophica (strain DSM 17448 / CIP 109782 / MTCC 6937 / GPTSA100-15) TaxID=929562 RepID=A0ABM5N6W8_EMTOG|nr:2-oxo acid dehydrogenase subunit E2 [Emticicia oligotrophica]AFK05289.1 pyruvate dehydrogenase complex dihydrolipoamide acetyltransferase [Emticicia oligotrophica DSM 17448]